MVELPETAPSFVGKYSSTMEHMGTVSYPIVPRECTEATRGGFGPGARTSRTEAGTADRTRPFPKWEVVKHGQKGDVIGKPSICIHVE